LTSSASPERLRAPELALHDVAKSFDRPVLASVSLEIPAGCLYGLIGPGAAGKSIVLKTIAGLIRADSGRVVVDGRDIGTLDERALEAHRRDIGMLFQNNALFDFMTVEQNVGFPLRRLTALDDAEIAARVRERMARVGLPGFETRMPSGLSGGQKKRVGIARATITGAPLVLFDEPAAGLDPVSSQRIFNLLRDEQRATQATTVIVSSDLDRMLSVVDRVAMLHRGRTVFEGTPAEARASADPLVRQFVHGLGEGPL
jgi:phospholipid/cholesterol/gamma-HCH transport system ATP-binding protein